MFDILFKILAAVLTYAFTYVFWVLKKYFINEELCWNMFACYGPYKFSILSVGFTYLFFFQSRA